MGERPPKLEQHEIEAGLSGLPGWSVEEGVLRKQFRFGSFMDAIRFVNMAADIAEMMDHHPDILIRFGLVTISLVTHSAKGLTMLDFEQAAQLEELAQF